MKKISLLVIVLSLFFIVFPISAAVKYSKIDLLNVSGHFQFHFIKKKIGIKSGFVSYTIQNLSETKKIRGIVFTRPINGKIKFISDRSGRLKYRLKKQYVIVPLRRQLHYAQQVILSIGYSVKQLTTKNKNIRNLNSSFINDKTILLSPYYWLVFPQLIHRSKISPFVKIKNMDITLIFPANKYTLLPYKDVESKKVEKGKFIKYFYTKHKYVPLFRSLSLLLSVFEKRKKIVHKGCKIDFNIAHASQAKYEQLKSFVKKSLDVINTNLSFLTPLKKLSINEIKMKWNPKLVHFEGSSFGRNANFYTATNSEFEKQKLTIVHEILHCHLGKFNLYTNFEEGLVVFLEKYLMFKMSTDIKKKSKKFSRKTYLNTLQGFRNKILLYKTVLKKSEEIILLMKAKKISKKEATQSLKKLLSKSNVVMINRYLITYSFFHYMYDILGWEKMYSFIKSFLDDKKEAKTMFLLANTLKETQGSHFLDYHKYLFSKNIQNLVSLRKSGKNVVIKNNAKFRLFFRLHRVGENGEESNGKVLNLKPGEKKVVSIDSTKISFVYVGYYLSAIDANIDDNFIKL